MADVGVDADFTDAYIAYIGESEVPKLFTRWSALTLLGAYLERNFVFSHGHFEIYPNMYVMLMGISATRKTTAIKTASKLLRSAGYTTVAASKTSKEKMLEDMAPNTAGEGEEDSAIDAILFGTDVDEKSYSPLLINADEFNNFIGVNNYEFASLLGELWDYVGVYKFRVRTGKSVSIPNPTISILGGNTPSGFAKAFPPDLIDQGFFSRLILVHSEPTGRRITFPKPPSEEDKAKMVELLQAIRGTCLGAAKLSPEAEKLLHSIYQSWEWLTDPRFASYSNRRFTHLIKLCMIYCAARISTTIEAQDVLKANTVLTHTEALMPRALGEYGRSRASEISELVYRLLQNTHKPLTIQEIYTKVAQDIDKINDLMTILHKLTLGNKVAASDDGTFIAIKQSVANSESSAYILPDYLTSEELEM